MNASSNHMISKERYAWLAFVDAQSKKYQEYIEKLASDITKSEEYQDYFDIINELEKEGREEMAYEFINKYIRELPFEKQMRLINSVIPSDRQQEAVGDILRQMPKEQRKKIFGQFQAELTEMFAEQVTHQKTGSERR